jgi:hypothetical protein
MSDLSHTNEAQLTPGTDFDFVIVTDFVPSKFLGEAQSHENIPVPTTSNASCFDAASLKAFHEEFKGLVLAGDEPSHVDWDTEIAGELFASQEQETAESSDVVAPIPTSLTVPVNAAAPRQIVRPLVGPRLGTPLPLETWVVKVVIVLIGMNIFFAGLIVLEVRIVDLFN